MKTHARALFLLSIAALVAVACTREPPTPFSRENTQKLTATVDDIDYQTRLLTLTGEGGTSRTIEVGPEVRNFAQIKKGDQVVVDYYEGVAAEVKAPGSAPSEPEAAVGAARAPVGDRPAAAVGSVVTTTLTIQDYDSKNNMVTFARPDGQVRVLKLEDPKAQEFAKKLKKGDQVEVTFTEALAVSVQPKN